MSKSIDIFDGTQPTIEQRVAELEAALAKQRLVNEELWAWFRDDCNDPISESLAKALGDALK